MSENCAPSCSELRVLGARTSAPASFASMREASCSRAAASAALVFAAIAWARFTAKAFFSARADRILCRFRCASSARLASTESRLFFESSCTCRFWRACSVRSEKLFARSFRVRSAASARRAAFAFFSASASAEISDAVRSRRRRGGEEGSSKGVGVLAMLITMEVMRFACKPRLEAEIFEPVHDDLRSPAKQRRAHYFNYSSARYSVEPA